jgi:hypothetical protein
MCVIVYERYKRGEKKDGMKKKKSKDKTYNERKKRKEIGGE